MLTNFTDYQDPKPRSRPVFTFHRPETFRERLGKEQSLRARLHSIPKLSQRALRECQSIAINNPESSFHNARPRALIQMATGSGKTFAAIISIYRLLEDDAFKETTPEFNVHDYTLPVVLTDAQEDGGLFGFRF